MGTFLGLHRHAAAMAIAALVFCLRGEETGVARADPPNVILIYADDISAREFPVYGSSVWSGFRGQDTTDPAYRARTPVIDRLANEGVWFANAWAATVCSPSRAMMMTGRYASTHKWWHNRDYGMIRDDAGRKQVVPLYHTSPLLIGHVARRAGYATMWCGKTQMKGADLQQFGFDEGVFTPGPYAKTDNPHTDFVLQTVKTGSSIQLVNADTGDAVQTYQQRSWYWQPAVLLMNQPSRGRGMEWWPNTDQSRADYGLSTYGPDVELDFALDFMRRQCESSRPFFVYHTTHLGHDAFNWLNPASKEKWPGTPVIDWDGQRYTRTAPQVAGDRGDYNTHGTVTPAGIKSHLEYLDYQVWSYLQELERLGVDDNTVLILAADNGTIGYGKGSHDRQKGCHVPLIVHAPGLGLTKRGRLDGVASMADLLPTLGDISGKDLPDTYAVDGRSFWPTLTTGAKRHREWVYAYKSERQLIRSLGLLRDGAGKWWDVSRQPNDLIDFRQIRDWDSESQANRRERRRLAAVLAEYDDYDTAHDP